MPKATCPLEQGSRSNDVPVLCGSSGIVQRKSTACLQENALPLVHNLPLTQLRYAYSLYHAQQDRGFGSVTCDDSTCPARFALDDRSFFHSQSYDFGHNATHCRCLRFIQRPMQRLRFVSRSFAHGTVFQNRHVAYAGPAERCSTLIFALGAQATKVALVLAHWRIRSLA